MKRLFNTVITILKALVVLFCTALVATVTLQIFGRYFFKAPLPWTEELSRMLMVLIVTAAAPLAAYYDRYVRVDVVFAHFPSKAKETYVAIMDIVVAVFLLMVAYHAVSLMVVGRLQKTPVLSVSMGVLYGAMVVCPGLSALCFIYRSVENFRRLFGKVETDEV